MMTSTVDAVIVSFNSEKHLVACIRAVRAWSRLGRVIVVDNASVDASVAVARAWADDVVVSTRNLGYGAGQNMGITRSGADYVLLLNPDARVVPEALERGFAQIDGCCNIAAVQGTIRRSADGHPERTHGREPGLADLAAHRFRLRQRVGEGALRRIAPLVGRRDFADRVPAGPVRTPFLAAVAPLVRRAAFDDVGGFDEGYFLYAEDVDLSHRLCIRGWRLMAIPDEWALHAGGASSADTPRRREDEWWRAHRRLVEQHWTGTRRTLGLALTRRHAGTVHG